MFSLQAVYFVTRLKSDANIGVLETRPLPPGSAILNDQIVRLHGLTHREKPRYRFRRVEIEDPDQGRLVFLTNHLRLAAATIAGIYRERWRIEVFFKALKQNLKNQNVRWSDAQRIEDPGLDSTDRHVDPAPG